MQAKYHRKKIILSSIERSSSRHALSLCPGVPSLNTDSVSCMLWGVRLQTIKPKQTELIRWMLYDPLAPHTEKRATVLRFLKQPNRDRLELQAQRTDGFQFRRKKNLCPGIKPAIPGHGGIRRLQGAGLRRKERGEAEHMASHQMDPTSVDIIEPEGCATCRPPRAHALSVMETQLARDSTRIATAFVSSIYSSKKQKP